VRTGENMSNYVISFSKNGYIKYTSHLDMLRLFKRAFRRSGIILTYSQGFNPHPKMSFAQPLSLGYSARAELLEFESEIDYQKDAFIEAIGPSLPAGITVTGFGKSHHKKSLAARVSSADYSVVFPSPFCSEDFDSILRAYLGQETILAPKRRKKDKKIVDIDIRGKIISASVRPEKERYFLQLDLELDCGSQSNLSPELVIKTFTDFAGLECERYRIEVCRNKMSFSLDPEIEWM